VWIRDRSRALNRCAEAAWDLVVVGAGIVGAAVANQATRAGLRALVVDRGDFASGTSSRSTKLIHGGFRYLAQGHLGLVREAARERERLLREPWGPVTPVGFTFAAYNGDGTSLPAMRVGSRLYALLAHPSRVQILSPERVLALAPVVRREGLRRGFRAVEGTVDDARLVLRLLADAVAGGAGALNYVAADDVRAPAAGPCEVALRDVETGRIVTATARVVVNATGVAADALRSGGEPLHVRPLRGSHLLFAASRLPLTEGIAFRHPEDGRYVSATPWEGVVVMGTTEREHSGLPGAAPSAGPDEAAYLLAGARATFPALELSENDVVATLGGVRALVGRPGAPGAASREDVLLAEGRLVTVTGGKLTTFRPMARRVLEAARPHLPPFKLPAPSAPTFAPAAVPEGPALDDGAARRLVRLYGAAASDVAAAARDGELEGVPGTPVLWAELRWAARAEGVVHLHDLLLRRTRLGLLLRDGGAELLGRIRDIVREEMGWSPAQWAAEAEDYRRRRREEHGWPA
jgi:glycerol-3-phosphate dehydrogenase